MSTSARQTNVEVQHQMEKKKKKGGSRTNKIMCFQALENLSFGYSKLPLERPGILWGLSRVPLIEEPRRSQPVTRLHLGRSPLVLRSKVHKCVELGVVNDKRNGVDASVDLEDEL
jgi:hypothetical protein